ncbi:GGDEF domain-containing protein [Glaciecola siphonariae]|uniref:diguanylate cyclase n=1 Tax=Glaciecola siphonariae TaxID=521012 RepID=A0ABV9LZQ5_9ALTE
MCSIDVVKALEKEHSTVKLFKGECAIAIIDIDRFKSVNDTYGHDIGDRAIKHIAEILQVNTNSTDIVARAGGEEFCIVMPQQDMQQSLFKLEQIRKQIELKPLVTDDYHIQMTVSIGLASMLEANSSSQAMKFADTALYGAKEAGRNRVVQYNNRLKRKS